jgi:NADH dehydrogenase FAD-containing subunit
MFINKISLFNQLAQYGVTILTGTKVVSIEEDGLVVEKKDGSQEKLPADTIINAFGMRQDLKTVDAVKAK